MTWKNAHKIADARRERVAALRLRGFSVREIISALAQEGVTNPETKKPFGIGTIARDLEYLKKEWQKNAARDIAEHRAEQLAELSELRKRNWELVDLAEVRNCLILEAKILGTPAPDKLQISGQIDLTKLTNEQLQRLVNGEPTTDVLAD